MVVFLGIVILLGITYFVFFTPSKLEKRKQKKEKQLARQLEEERLTKKYGNKKAIYLRERDALMDTEGCIFEELQFKNISTGLEFTKWCPQNIPVKICRARDKRVTCTLDQESVFDFSVQKIYLGGIAITHPLLGDCITNKTEICKGLNKGDVVHVKFHLVESKEVHMSGNELPTLHTIIHRTVYNKVIGE
ncbi:MAG: hypothetical protein LBO09_08095 [Candidatus Peribacteria bacterium]|jgi:hypothetical protein|nr:hypothetical protein [Candidatus Peribacteria bacterium]